MTLIFTASTAGSESLSYIIANPSAYFRIWLKFSSFQKSHEEFSLVCLNSEESQVRILDIANIEARRGSHLWWGSRAR